MKRFNMSVFVIVSALLFPLASFAHAHLKSASPSPKSLLHDAPKEVAIEFSEDLEPKFSSIEVKDSSGAKVDLGDVHLTAQGAKHLVVGLKPLPPGSYTVNWHVTSVDTHKSEGVFTFEVVP